jgi:hypothetical protein
MSQVKVWNLSYESLTSFEAREKLRGLKTTDPEFWSELTLNTLHKDLPDSNTAIEEDTINAPGDVDDYGDDSSISVSTVISEVMKGGTGREGGLVPQELAEDEDVEPVETIDMAVGHTDSSSHAMAPAVETPGLSAKRSLGDRMDERRGKRKRTANKWYALKSFIRHNDDEDSDIDM